MDEEYEALCQTHRRGEAITERNILLQSQLGDETGFWAQLCWLEPSRRLVMSGTRRELANLLLTGEGRKTLSTSLFIKTADIYVSVNTHDHPCSLCVSKHSLFFQDSQPEGRFTKYQSIRHFFHFLCLSPS